MSPSDSDRIRNREARGTRFLIWIPGLHLEYHVYILVWVFVIMSNQKLKMLKSGNTVFVP